MEISWTDVGSGGYILVSCAHSNASLGIVINIYCIYKMQPINHVRDETLITGRMMHSGTKRPPEKV